MRARNTCHVYNASLFQIPPPASLPERHHTQFAREGGSRHMFMDLRRGERLDEAFGGRRWRQAGEVATRRLCPMAGAVQEEGKGKSRVHRHGHGYLSTASN